MITGVPKEIKNNEYRVGLTPKYVKDRLGYPKDRLYGHSCNALDAWPTTCFYLYSVQVLSLTVLA